MMNAAPTIAAIARKAGVGKATVCRALGDTGSVASRTKARILALAEEMGYKPDPALSALAHRRWNRRPAAGVPLAFVFPADEDVFSRACWDAIRSRAVVAGYSIEPYFMRDFRSSAHAGRTLYHRGVRGLIVGHQPRTVPPIELEWDRFAVVSCGLRVDRFPSSIVMPNVFNGMKLCCQEIARAGFSRPGVVFMNEGPDDNTAYQIGAFMAQAAVPAVPPLMDASGFGPWFRKHRPDVVLASNLELVDDLRARGWRFPEDAPLVCFGWNTRRGEVAGLDLHVDLIGCSAFDLLDLQIRFSHQESGDRNKITHMIEPSWMPGATFSGRPKAGRAKRGVRGD